MVECLFSSLSSFFFVHVRVSSDPALPRARAAATGRDAELFFLFFFFKGAVHSHRVRSRLLEPGSEITGS